MVGATGFEPATSWSQTTRSTKLSYAPLVNRLTHQGGGNNQNEEPHRRADASRLAERFPDCSPRSARAIVSDGVARYSDLAKASAQHGKSPDCRLCEILRACGECWSDSWPVSFGLRRNETSTLGMNHSSDRPSRRDDVVRRWLRRHRTLRQRERGHSQLRQPTQGPHPRNHRTVQ
jgi:hypothetical protein